MKVIVPKPITLVSSNVAEESYPVWDSSATYNKDNIVLVENLGDNKITKKYQSVIDSNTGNYPPDNPDKWKDLGATNKWAMFDGYVNTQTENEDSIDVTITARKIDYIALLEIHGISADIEIYEHGTTNLLWSTHLDLTNSVYSWSQYFFEDITYQRSVSENLLNVGTDVAIYNLDVDIHIVLNAPEGTAKCGMVIAGYSYGIGDTQWYPKVGILDYSRKITDDFGRTYLQEGAWAKRIECDVSILTQDLDRVMRILASVRAKPCLWQLNNNTTNFDALLVYGFFKDFEIILSNPAISRCSLTIEGLI